MKRKAKSTAAKRRSGTWLIVFAVVIFVLILLLRMLIFVAPHGRNHF
jgi:Flp pilus assembly protein TadG